MKIRTTLSALSPFVGSHVSLYIELFNTQEPHLIVDLAFLSTLIKLRKASIRLASAEIDTPFCEETVVCWVDFFFACCTDFISSIAGNSRFNSGSAKNNLPIGLQGQKQEDSVRLACQLPCESRILSPPLKTNAQIRCVRSVSCSA